MPLYHIRVFNSDESTMSSIITQVIRYSDCIVEKKNIMLTIVIIIIIFIMTGRCSKVQGAFPKSAKGQSQNVVKIRYPIVEEIFWSFLESPLDPSLTSRIKPDYYTFMSLFTYLPCNLCEYNDCFHL